jgi:hypothetical protein
MAARLSSFGGLPNFPIRATVVTQQQSVCGDN